MNKNYFDQAKIVDGESVTKLINSIYSLIILTREIQAKLDLNCDLCV